LKFALLFEHVQARAFCNFFSSSTPLDYDLSFKDVPSKGAASSNS
jgi:hypothetical protein